MCTSTSSTPSLASCALRILATSDLHAHIAAYDYYADCETDDVGLTRAASLIRPLRDQVQNCLVFDNGDFLQGSPLGDYAFQRATEPPHPMIAAMNTIGYDAATYGNHEFNFGLRFLRQVTEQANFPFTVANIDSAGPTPFAPRYLILDKVIIDDEGHHHPLRVGVIGFTPPQIMIWDRGHLEGRISTSGIIEAAEKYIPEMKANGAEIVIALCHSGIADTPHYEGMEDAARHLGKVAGIDAIIAGHIHQTFPDKRFCGIEGIDVDAGTLFGTPAVMPGMWGSHVGAIDLQLSKSPEGWRCTGHSVNLPSIYKREAGKGIVPAVDDDTIVDTVGAASHQETLKYMRRIVGTSTVPLHSYFATAQNDLSVQIVAEAQREYARTVLEGTEHADLPLISAASPFKTGGRGGASYYVDIPKGPVAIKDIASLYLYPNRFHIVRTSGQQLFEWLERSVSLFHQIAPGTHDTPLIDPRFPPYNSDTLLGLTYDIDLTQPPRFSPLGILKTSDSKRIKNAKYNGLPLTNDMDIVVATNQYRAGGGGEFATAIKTTSIYDGPESSRDIVLNHIKRTPFFSPTLRDVWNFVHLPDTTVTFETGLGALRHLSDDIYSNISDTGIRQNGFATMRMTL